MQKLRRDMEDASVAHEGQMESLRKKHNDAIVELNEQLDLLQKARTK